MDLDTVEMKVCKVDDEEGIVYGMALVSTIKGEAHFDLQEHHIPQDVMRKAATEFMKNLRINRDMHGGEDTGMVVHSFPLTDDLKKAFGIDSAFTGWMVGVAPSTDSLQKFKSGEFAGFSISGDGELRDAA